MTRIIDAQSIQEFGVNFDYEKLICEFDEHNIHGILSDRKLRKRPIKRDKLKPRRKQKRTLFNRENSVEEITEYLRNQKNNNFPIRFWYRDDISPRKVSNYFIDEKYIQVKSDKGYYIKFLIDKVRKI